MSYLRKITNYAAIAMIVLFIIGANYFRGLFFDIDLYWIEISISLFFLIFLVIRFKEMKNLLTSKPYVWLIVLIPIMYLIQAFFAENQTLAYQQFFRWVLAIQFYLIILFLSNKKRIRNIVFYSILLMGVWTSIFGWLAAYKLVDFQNALLGYRIASVFQYPNTFGAIVASILLGLLIKSTNKNWKVSLISIFSYLLFVTMIFTYSRGSWIIFGVVWIFTLFFLTLRQQILFIIQSIIIGIAVIFTLVPLSNSISNDSALKGLWIIVIASLLSGTLYMGLYFFIFKFNINLKRKHILKFIIPVIIILLILAGTMFILKPSNIDKMPTFFKIRLSNINFETKSVVERNLFYGDATKMIKDSPIFGQGGGAWKELYERYQSYPYVSRQAHSFYYQMAIEIGLLGLIIFLSFIMLIIFSIIKSRKKLDEEDNSQLFTFGIMLLFLLTHSVIDFNMSYAYFLVVTMILLSLMSLPLEMKFKLKGVVSIISILLVITVSITSLALTTRFNTAEKQVQQIGQVGNDTELGFTLNHLIELNPYEVNYRFLKIQHYNALYNNTRNDNFIKLALDEASIIKNMNRGNPAILFQLAQVFANYGYLTDSINLLDKALVNGPWVESVYSQYSVYAYNLAKYYKHNDNNKGFNVMINKIFSLYDETVKRREILDQQPESLQYKKEFNPSQVLKLNTGKAYIVNQKYEQALAILEPLINNSDEGIKNETIAWIVYTYDKMNNQEKVNEYLNKENQETVLKMVDQIKKDWDE